jgi:hypothetical protein
MGKGHAGLLLLLLLWLYAAAVVSPPGRCGVEVKSASPILLCNPNDAKTILPSQNRTSSSADKE